MTDMDCVGLTLCGLGRMGMIHLGNIVNNRCVKLLYIVDVDMEKASKAIKDNCLHRTKAIHVDNIQEALSDDKVDGVVIATPTDMHGTLVMKSLEAGKHVLCEKPLSTHFGDVMKCYKMAKSKELVLLCAFNRRFDPQIRKLVSTKDKIGNLQSVKICSRDAPRPTVNYLKISGGIFHDCVVHDLDVARWIVGENPETIYTIAHCHDPEIAALDDVDTAFIVMKFPGGELVHIDVQRECVYGYDQTIQIYGNKGNMISANQRKTALIVDGGQIADEICDTFTDRYREAYITELNHFINLIQKKETKLCVEAYDTVHATCLSQAAEDSYREGRVIHVKPYMMKLCEKYGLDPDI